MSYELYERIIYLLSSESQNTTINEFIFSLSRCGLPKQKRGLSSYFRDEQATRVNVKVSKGSRGSVKKGLGISLVEVYEGHGNLSLQSVLWKDPRGLTNAF